MAEKPTSVREKSIYNVCLQDVKCLFLRNHPESITFCAKEPRRFWLGLVITPHNSEWNYVIYSQSCSALFIPLTTIIWELKIVFCSAVCGGQDLTLNSGPSGSSWQLHSTPATIIFPKGSSYLVEHKVVVIALCFLTSSNIYKRFPSPRGVISATLSLSHWIFPSTSFLTCLEGVGELREVGYVFFIGFCFLANAKVKYKTK